MADSTKFPPPPQNPSRLFRVKNLLEKIDEAEQPNNEGELPKDFDMPFVSLSTQVSTLPDGATFRGTIKSLSIGTPVEPLTRPADQETVDMIERMVQTNNVFNPPLTIYNNEELYLAWKRKADILRTAWELETFFESKEHYRRLLQEHLAEGVKQGNK